MLNKRTDTRIWKRFWGKMSSGSPSVLSWLYLILDLANAFTKSKRSHILLEEGDMVMEKMESVMFPHRLARRAVPGC